MNDEWKLVTQAKLEKVEHGPAPKGNFCAHAGIDFCTPKENMAGEVHKNIERYLSPRIMKEPRESRARTAEEPRLASAGGGAVGWRAEAAPVAEGGRQIVPDCAAVLVQRGSLARLRAKDVRSLGAFAGGR